MRLVAQRVSKAQVLVSGEVVGAIDHGLLLLVGIGPDDTERDASALSSKIAGLRVFSDDDGHMNLDVGEVGGGILAVSQFTLMADTRKGRRPSFIGAADPAVAGPLFDAFVQMLRVAVADCVPVETGSFGAQMAVELVNDGPVTIVLETADGRVL